MVDPLRYVEEDLVKGELPDIKPGDLIKIDEKVGGSSKKRTQVFEGVVLKLSGSGPNKMVTVRKVSAGIGVEKTLPLHSPKIESVQLVKENHVGQARPYYLRERGK